MPCGLSSAFFKSTLVFEALFLAACTTQSLHPERGHFTVTRFDEAPACRELGIVPLYEITAEEMSPLMPMTRATLEEISAKARGLGANFIVVRPGPLGPEGRNFKCG